MFLLYQKCTLYEKALNLRQKQLAIMFPAVFAVKSIVKLDVIFLIPSLFAVIYQNYKFYH